MIAFSPVNGVICPIFLIASPLRKHKLYPVTRQPRDQCLLPAYQQLVQLPCSFDNEPERTRGGGGALSREISPCGHGSRKVFLFSGHQWMTAYVGAHRSMMWCLKSRKYCFLVNLRQRYSLDYRGTTSKKDTQKVSEIVRFSPFLPFCIQTVSELERNVMKQGRK